MIPSFNPHASDGTRQHLAYPNKFVSYVSIHTPRMGRDPRLPLMRHRYGGFNPRVLDGTRPKLLGSLWTTEMFQSPRPGWDATDAKMASITMPVFQSTRPGWDGD
jgi:hypothetical protein